MPKIDRKDPRDAKKITEQFLPEENSRLAILSFLVESIDYANQLNRENWNLNLDKNGKFIQFNVGHEYCLRISIGKLYILCLRESLKEKIKGKNLDIEFQGYYFKEKRYINSRNIDAVPDILKKVPDSVGCFISPSNFDKYLPLFRDSNRAFLKYGILNTKIKDGMKNAHSKGYLEYLLELGLF